MRIQYPESVWFKSTVELLISSVFGERARMACLRCYLVRSARYCVSTERFMCWLPYTTVVESSTHTSLVDRERDTVTLCASRGDYASDFAWH